MFENFFIYINNIVLVLGAQCNGDSNVELVVKYLPASSRDIRYTGSIPRSGRSPGGGHGNPLQYSSLENPMDRRVGWATVHRVAKSQT